MPKICMIGVLMMQSAEEFVSLRTSDDPHAYGRAASEDASIDTWLDGRARDADPLVREAVVFKRKLDSQLFKLLSNDPEEMVRQRIAYNRRTPTDILDRLASDESSIVSDTARKRLGGLHQAGYRELRILAAQLAENPIWPAALKRL